MTQESNRSRFRLTLKAWPVIAALTIGLCFLTQTVAGWFGIELKEQANVELVKRCLTHAFSSARAFGVAALLVAQVIVIMPALEELVFRGLLFKLPLWLRNRSTEFPRPFAAAGMAVLSSALFSAAHYIAQPWPDNAFFALFFFGLAQCALYLKTDRIWCSMTNHALFNLTNLVLLFVVPTP